MFRVLLLSFLAMDASRAAEFIGRFDASSSAPPPPWTVERFDADVPATRFQVISWDNVAAVEAVADASMAILSRPLVVDLSTAPVLCWRWRIDAPLRTADLATRAGDDFAARLYIAFRVPSEAMGRIARMQLRLARSLYGDRVPDAALNYVWDNQYPIGTLHPNAYTDRARMLVLRSGAAEAGGWVEERRDVLQDATAAFELRGLRASFIALASDTDNTGEYARAGFADLHFVARKEPCAFPSLLSGG